MNEPSQPTQPAPKISLSRKTIVIGIGVAIMLAAVLGVRYAIIRTAEEAQQAASALATEAASTIASALGITPHVTVNGLTVIEQRSEIAELAVLQQSVFKEYSWSHTWLGSTKTLVLRGEFIAKTGLNLKEPWSLTIETSKAAQANVLTLVLPPARLLSLEMKTYLVNKDESGFWNAITAQDRENAVNAMQAEVRASIEGTRASGAGGASGGVSAANDNRNSILADTQREAERRLRGILQPVIGRATAGSEAINRNGTENDGKNSAKNGTKNQNDGTSGQTTTVYDSPQAAPELIVTTKNEEK